MIWLKKNMNLTTRKNWLALSLFGLSFLVITAAQAVSVNGPIDPGKYQWNTAAPANSKWNTNGTSDSEVHDGSGGVEWDIDFMGFDISDKKFSFGIQGGSILSGENTFRSSQTLWLGDLAIDVGGDKDFDYGIVLGLNSDGSTAFELYQVETWSGVNRYNRTPGTRHTTEFYKIETANVDGVEKQVQTVNGDYQKYQGDGEVLGKSDPGTLGPVDGKYIEGDPDKANYVLEGSFDLSLLSLFDPKIGGEVIMYLAMSCVNDEAIVNAHVSPVPLPSAVWLFGSALIGFIGMSRRTRV